jgi:hypothetical protein
MVVEEHQATKGKSEKDRRDGDNKATDAGRGRFDRENKHVELDVELEVLDERDPRKKDAKSPETTFAVDSVWIVRGFTGLALNAHGTAHNEKKGKDQREKVPA